jgi:hypothetical protein
MRVRGRWIVVCCHATAVACLVGGFLVAEAAYEGPDANIGAGMAGLALTGLGLPWSLGAPAEGDGRALFVVGSAVLNVGIGAALAYWRGRAPGAG